MRWASLLLSAEHGVISRKIIIVTHIADAVTLLYRLDRLLLYSPLYLRYIDNTRLAGSDATLSVVPYTFGLEICGWKA
jgi:hypothetical protein